MALPGRALHIPAGKAGLAQGSVSSFVHWCLWSWWSASRGRWRAGPASRSPAWGTRRWEQPCDLPMRPAEPGLTRAWARCSTHCWALVHSLGHLVQSQRGEESPQCPTFCCVHRRPLSCPMAPMMAALWSSLQGSSCCCRRCSRNFGTKGTVYTYLLPGELPPGGCWPPCLP